MRLPYSGGKPDRKESIRLMNIAFDSGVNYFDTAPLYCDRESESIVGEFLRGVPRDKVSLSTKDSGRAPGDFAESFERSFKNLRTDYVDMFHAWALSLADFRKIASNGTLDLLFKAKKEGKVRHASFSFHDDKPENVREVIDSGLFESVLLSFNMIKRDNLRWLNYARSKGLAVLVMNPVAGGNLAVQARLALKYVWSLPFIDVALSGMSDERQVRENCETASGSFAFTPDEERLLNENRQGTQRVARPVLHGVRLLQGLPRKD
jgi:predicted aldo/keto reductase-like oxidoreductase